MNLDKPTLVAYKGLFGTKECKTEERKKKQEWGLGVVGKQRNGKTQERHR